MEWRHVIGAEKRWESGAVFTIVNKVIKFYRAIAYGYVRARKSHIRALG